MERFTNTWCRVTPLQHLIEFPFRDSIVLFFTAQLSGELFNVLLKAERDAAVLSHAAHTGTRSPVPSFIPRRVWRAYRRAASSSFRIPSGSWNMFVCLSFSDATGPSRSPFFTPSSFFVLLTEKLTAELNLVFHQRWEGSSVRHQGIWWSRSARFPSRLVSQKLIGCLTQTCV